MTNDERLKIAEELLDAVLKTCNGVYLGDLCFYQTVNGNWTVARDKGHVAGIVLGMSQDPIEAIHQARQKLAAERDANKSARERRLEAFVQYACEWALNGHSVNTLKSKALEALKD